MKNEEKDKKIFYTISEVADMFDVNQSQLRSWEKQFPTLHPYRNRKGNRLFTPEDIEIVKVIYNLVKIKGLKVSSAVKEIGISENHLRRNSQVTERLLSIKAQLSSVLEQLDSEVSGESVVYSGKK
ncbi:MAG: MerR family transcriptional regulator [Rikenellaceae bacterium]